MPLRPPFVSRSAVARIKQHRRLFSCTTTTQTPPPSPSSPSPTKNDNNKVIFSGIQPTGVPHLGNYLGAMKNWVRLQNDAAPATQLLFAVVDLHAITVPQRADQLRAQRRDMLAALLAVGLDPARCTIFYQSDVPAHAELMWILSCTASMGYLSRMTQWKSKLSLSDTASALDDKAKAALKLGLFSYPVLQAADILVHRATHVPVGEDQKQHLEFARECATNFNATYTPQTPLLIPPETLLSPARRVMSLTKPTAKMSKSDPNPASRILLTDSPHEITTKIARALTDSSSDGVTYDPAARPGVSNLLEILALLRGGGDDAAATVEDVVREFAGVEKPLKALKAAVAEAVVAELEPVRERYRMVAATQVDETARAGAEKAGERARETMGLVRECMGMV